MIDDRMLDLGLPRMCDIAAHLTALCASAGDTPCEQLPAEIGPFDAWLLREAVARIETWSDSIRRLASEAARLSIEIRQERQANAALRLQIERYQRPAIKPNVFGADGEGPIYFEDLDPSALRDGIIQRKPAEMPVSANTETTQDATSGVPL